MRKTMTVTIAAEGRDKGKVFHLEEMSARQAERWARRALAEMVRSGAQIPEDIVSSGWGGLLAMGARGLFGAVGPEIDALHDELLACVALQPDPHHPEVKRRLIDDDTEEIATLELLKDEVFKLHSGFSVAAALSKIFAAARSVIEPMLTTSTSAES